jgi:hypothetical protein
MLRSKRIKPQGAARSHRLKQLHVPMAPRRIEPEVMEYFRKATNLATDDQEFLVKS